MNWKPLLRIAFIFCIVLVNIGCDQVTKEVVRGRVFPHETISVLGENLIVTHVENSGAFLSLGDSLPAFWKNILLNMIPSIGILLGVVYVVRKKNVKGLTLFALCCILGGGIGNIIDRILYGSVTDFLHIDLGLFRTGIFNMADVSITLGACIILLKLFFKREQPAAPQPE